MTEREKKYIISQNDYQRLCKKYDCKEVLQTNFYFRSENKQVPMVRLRSKEGTYELTVKLNATKENGLFVSDEINSPISQQEATAFLMDGITKNKVREHLGLDIATDVFCIGSLDTYRSKIPFNDVVLELDKNVYGKETDYELECELNEDQEPTLDLFLKENFSQTPEPSSMSKFKRFLKTLN